METQIFEINDVIRDKEKIIKAAKVIEDGGTVAFPTETVYGLGANGLDNKAVEKIFLAKGRPSDNPLILHIAEHNELNQLISEIPPKAALLINNFWPGPLTLIFNKSKNIPKRVTAGLDTVAVRMPSHPIAREIIKSCALPVAAPSANLSGKPSPTKAEHVINDLTGRVNVIIVADNSEIGLESTVVDVTHEIPIILRPGAITYEQLKGVVGEIKIDKSIIEKVSLDKVKSPGMKYTHYAPKASLTIVKGNHKKVVEKIQQLTEQYENNGQDVGILTTEETKDKYTKGIALSVGTRKNSESIAQNLFAVLREFDKLDVDIIFAEDIDIEGIGLAIVNRMYKAAGYNFIFV